MLSWIVRLFGMVLAAVQLTLLSMNYFGIIEYSVPFQEFMRWLGDWFASFFAPVEEWIRWLLAMIAIPLPKLGGHWHHAFVLMWLLLGSHARMFAGLLAVDAPLLSGVWFRNAARLLAILAWAGVCALISAVATGTVALNDPAVWIWPLAGVSVFHAGAGLGRVLDGHARWWGVAASGFVLATVLVCLGFILTKPMKALFGIVSDSPGLLFVFGLVGAFGVVLPIFAAWYLRRGWTWRKWLTDPATAFGIDIWGAYAIALTFAVVFGNVLG